MKVDWGLIYLHISILMSVSMNRVILESFTARGWIAWINPHMLQYAPIHLQNQFLYLFHLVAKQGLLLWTSFRCDPFHTLNMNCLIFSAVKLLWFFCNGSLQLQMSNQGSFLICQKKHFKWFYLRSLIRTWGTHYNLALGCTMLVWMTRIDLWQRNFLQTTRSRHYSIVFHLFPN